MTATDPELLGNQQQMSVDGRDGDKKANGDLSGRWILPLNRLQQPAETEQEP